MSDPIAAVVTEEEPTAGLALAPNEPEFRMVVRGYDRFEVDSYIDQLRRELIEAEEHRSPSSAVRRALEQVGDEVAGILQRAHETASEVTDSARREAEERLESSRRVADERITEAKLGATALTAQAEAKIRELDIDTDRIWAERDRIVTDARDLARQLTALADAAAERFPAEA
jgi:DivIVA domain-containing protein